MGSRQRGQIFRNRDGSYSYRFRTPSGTRPMRGGFRTRADAQQALNTELARLGTGSYTGERVTFDELADRFLASYEAGPATTKKMAFLLQSMRRDFGDVPVDRLSPERIAQWRKTVSARSRHGAHAALRQVLRFGIDIGCLYDNPALKIRNKQAPRREARFFDCWDEVLRVAAELPERYRGVPILGAGTGLRPSEWCALRWSDIDENALVVRQTYTEERGLQAVGKTASFRRRVPLRRLVRDTLDSMDQSAGLVFPTPEGHCIRIRQFTQRHWAPAVAAAGLEPHNLYALRHSFASWWLASGGSLFTLARRMGTSIEMINSHYGHLVSDADDQDIERLDRYDAEAAG